MKQNDSFESVSSGHVPEHEESCQCGQHDHHSAAHHEHEIHEIHDVESYFRSLNPKVAFIELKENAEAAPSELVGIPLPIRVRDFLDGVETRFSEEIPVRALLNGMVWMLAIDPEFRYIADYRRFMEQVTKDPVGFAMDLGMNDFKQAYQLRVNRNKQSGTILDEEVPEEVDESVDSSVHDLLQGALLSFRAAHLLDPHHVFAATQYARLLWQIGQEDYFVEEANHLLEHALSHDEQNPYTNAALGDLNVQLGQFLKATSYYQRAVANTSDAAVLEELRANMNRIAPDAAVENAIYFLRRADYAHAIEALMKAKAESSRYDVDYYLGIAYQNTSNYEAAAAAFRSALERGGDLPDIHNGLVYALNAQGRIEEAILAASTGLDAHPDDLRLRFNRAVLYADQQEPKKALEDLDAILEYADLSDELFDQVMRLRETLKLEEKP